MRRALLVFVLMGPLFARAELVRYPGVRIPQRENPPTHYQCGPTSLVIENGGDVMRLNDVPFDAEWDVEDRVARLEGHLVEFHPNADLTLDDTPCLILAP